MNDIKEPLDPETQAPSETTQNTKNLLINHRLSNPSPAQLTKLDWIDSLPFYKRIFRKMEKGSLRSVVILWLRMTMGIGVMTLPYYMSHFGLTGGIAALCICALLVLFSFYFIFEASVKTGKKDFKDLIDELLPGPISKTFTVTYFYDLCVPIIVYGAVIWSMFCYVLDFFGLLKEEWIEDRDKLLLYEYNLEVFLLRAAFYVVVFIISIPLFLKKDIGSLKNIAYAFLVVMIGYLVYIMVEAPFFMKNYGEKNTLVVEYLFKAPQWSWVVSFFSMLLSYYVQPFILLLRRELLSPTLKRLNKVASYGIYFEFFIFVAFSSLCYASFGDTYTPPLMILRVPYKGKSNVSEYIFKGGLFLFFMLTLLGLCIYNVGVREYLGKFVSFRNKKFEYGFLSLFPFFCCCLIGLLLPRITDLFSYSGLIFCNFNGFVIPTLLKLQVTRLEKGNKFKLSLIYLLIVFYIVAGLGGFVVKLIE